MAIKTGKKPDISSEDLKAQIAKAARKHFAVHGFSGASLKEIAQEAKVAGSLINYHFKDREGLFRACMEPFARQRMEAIPRILGEPRNREELKLRIELFVQEMQAGLLEEVECFEIMDREVRAGNPVILKLFEDTMLGAFKHVVGFFKKAQDADLISKDLEPMMLSTILFTSTCDVIRKEQLAKRFFGVSWTDPAWRKKYAHNISELFVKGVAT